MHHRHRRIIAAATLLAFAAVLGGPVSAPAQSGPVKIGLLVPLTGAFAAIGKDMLNGTELYLDEIGRQVAGRKIELIVEDTEGNTATALTKARKLVDQDKIHVLTGGLLASTGYALHPFADAQRIPARAHQRRSLGQSRAEHLRAKGREGRGQAAEHRRRHVPGGQSVLEVQPRGVPEAATLYTRDYPPCKAC